VFVLKQKYAVKIPRRRLFQEGLRANLHEQETWRQSRADHLCPILLAGPFGLFSVMPYARPLSDAEYNTLENDYLNEGGLFAQKLKGDFKRENFGMLDGRRVRLDYERYQQ
jgi:hypothetical protein